MPLAIGGASSTRSQQSRYRVDVRDYGARAEFGFDCHQAFQAAVDDLAERIATDFPPGSGGRVVGTVFVPATKEAFRLSRPVWVDSPFIEIRGEGQGSRVATFPQYNIPLFIFGLRRTATVLVNNQLRTLVPDASYRPDLFGKLDSSAASSPNQRWGFRTHGDAIIQSQADPFSAGARSLRQDFSTDNWVETTKLTLEFCVEAPNNGPMPAYAPLFGMGVATSDLAYPFIVYMHDNNTYRITFCTQSPNFGDLTPRTFWISSGNATGPQRITLQIDLDTAQVSGFVNGVQVGTTNFLGPNWGPGLRFAENDYYPMLIADSGGNRPQLGAANGFDYSLYGLLFSRSLRYRNDGIGQPQRRADNPSAAINDRYRYFTFPSDDADAIGYLAFTDNPSELSRFLTIQGGPAANGHIAAAFLLHSYQTVPGGIVDNGIHNVHLIGGHIYGQNVAIGQILDLRMTGIRSTDAYHAVGCLSNGANYMLRMEDCVLDATDSCLFALNQGIWARNITFAGAGRATMRFAGCVVDMQDFFVGFAAPHNQSTIKIHASDYGGNYNFNNFIVDYEGDVYKHTAIYCEAHPFAAATSLRIRDAYFGTIGDAAVITLKDVSPGYPKSYLSVENLQAYSDHYKVFLSLDGSGWHGEVKGSALGKGPRITHLNKLGGEANVLIRETHFKAPPRINRWQVGAHALEVRSPADGQFQEWRCVATGTYGTSAPPRWMGLHPVNVHPTALAAYVTNHAYMTVTLS